MHCRSLDSDELRYKSRELKLVICSHDALPQDLREVPVFDNLCVDCKAIV